MTPDGDAMPALHAIVIMGPCGCGKSDIGKRLASAYQVNFVDGDDFHPKENVEKMGAGIPLTDQDRIPWLLRVREECVKEVISNSNSTRKQIGVVLACSALKVMYRNIIRHGGKMGGETETPSRTENANASRSVTFIFVLLNCSRSELERRLEQRAGHFMKKDMLESQLKTLEQFNQEEVESSIVVNGDLPVSIIVDEIQAKMPCIWKKFLKPE